MRARLEFAAALVLDALAAAGALLIATRTWQTVLTPRSRPFADDVLDVTGRTIDTAPTAVALVALAGFVAVLATRGLARRVVGAVVLVAGAVLVWRALAALPPVPAAQARAFVRDEHPRVSLSNAVAPHVSTHPVWAVLSAACGVLIVVAGLAVVTHGARWAAMSARYEAPRRSEPDEAVAKARGEAALWAALERGEDPTARPEQQRPS